MNRMLIPAVLLAILATPAVMSAESAPVDPACGTTCAACARALPHQLDQAASAHIAKPWYIGPKGGDTRKGLVASPSAAQTVIQDHDAAPAVAATAFPPKPWYIGPKGGDTRKGHSALPGEGPSMVPAAAFCSAYVAPEHGPKGGPPSLKGQPEVNRSRAADDACLTACAR